MTTSGDPLVSSDSSPASIEMFDPPGTRRVFSPGDLLRLLIWLALIAGGTLVGALARSTIRGVELDLLQLVDRLPDTFEDLLLAIAQLFTRVIATVALVMLLVTRRWRVALLLVLAGLLADLAMGAVDVFLFDRDLEELVALLRAEQNA